MRTIEKQRIFNRFMAGESCDGIAHSMWEQATSGVRYEFIRQVEQTIRSCVWDEIAKVKK